MPTDAELIESAWGQPIDPMDQYDADWDWSRRTGTTGFATGRLDDHTGGKNRPVFETESDLDAMRAAADVLCETSAHAIGALKNLTNFVIGPGFTYVAAPKPRRDKDPQAVAAVQEIIDEFLEDNDWCGDRERELFGKSRRHGEFFLSVVDHGGQAEVRNIAAARVKEPRVVPEYGMSATFGVETPADDLELELGYWVQWDSLDGQLEFVDATKAEHVKINVDRGIKRGVSDFFCVDPDLGAARTLLRSMVKGGSIQASIAYIVEHAAGATQTQIENLRTNNATLKYDQTYQTGTRTNYQSKLKPGQRLDVGKGQVYKGSPLASGEAANAYVTILQAGLRSIGSRWCMPEYMISGDASNANYSSTMVAESPFVRNCEVEQAFYKRKFLRVLWSAVRIAVEAGRIPGRSFEQIKRLVEIQVECPQVAARNALQETQRRAVLHEAKILSDKTWASQEGLDHDQEQTNIAAQPKPEVLAPLQQGQTEQRPASPFESEQLTALHSSVRDLRESFIDLRNLQQQQPDQSLLIESAVNTALSKVRAVQRTGNTSAIVAALEHTRTKEEATAILLESWPEGLFTELSEKIDRLQADNETQRSALLEEVDDVNAAVADAIKSLSEAIAQQGQQKIVVPAPQVKVDMQPVEAAVKEMTKAIREDIASRNYDIVRTDASGQEVHYTRVPKS